jgi:DNA excision repair protein ERCC-3
MYVLATRGTTEEDFARQQTRHLAAKGIRVTERDAPQVEPALQDDDAEDGTSDDGDEGADDAGGAVDSDEGMDDSDGAVDGDGEAGGAADGDDPDVDPER